MQLLPLQERLVLLVPVLLLLDQLLLADGRKPHLTVRKTLLIELLGLLLLTEPLVPALGVLLALRFHP